MIPVSTSTHERRMRQSHAQRRALVRSNSSLLGSIKNFVAAPFARLFTGNPDDFDDPNDYSGKRGRIVNYQADNNDIVEDGPAPAKRMRVRSPEPSPPSRNSAGYLDPPRSAFQQKNNNYLSHNPSGRSASISIPPTTLPDTGYNARSTLSPLRNHFSRNMSLDPIPSQQQRPLSLSRDITMQSISSLPPEDRNVTMRSSSRDSLPPITSRPSFRMRGSMTPQPRRDVSEPPPITTLSSNPVFVRGPSQVNEPQPQPVATLGSLVDSQRHVRSPTRQRTLLFGSSQSPVDPQAAVAERTLQELDFYKTPLVPTRLRSKLSNSVTAASTSSITDMFSRKKSLILMGDHDRPSRSTKKNKDKRKGKGTEKEANETKPYAGTTGIKKRLAKAKVVSEDQQFSPSMETAEVYEETKNASSSPQEPFVPELPLPPAQEKDTFSVAAFPPSDRKTQTSSLRVGRAARSHLSRPVKKFSAAYDEEDDRVSDEAQKEFEMIEEAAKKAPIFEISAGFSFAKDTNSIELNSTSAKEPPISSLPFSLTKPAASVPAPAPQSTNAPPASEAVPPKSAFGAPALAPTPTSGVSSSLFSAPVVPSRTSEDAFTTPVSTSAIGLPTEASDVGGKVPNFFTSSKTLTSQPPTPPAAPAFPAPADSTPSFSPAPSAPATSPFSFGQTPAVPVKDNAGTLWGGDKKEEESAKPALFAPVSTSNTSLPFSIGGQAASSSIPAPFTPIPTPPAESATKDEQNLSSFSFSAPADSAPQPPAAAAQTSLFSFTKPAETAQSSSATSAPFSFGAAPASSTAAADSAPKPAPFSFGASATPASSGLFSETAKPANSSLFSSFGQSSSTTETAGTSSTMTAKSLFGVPSGSTDKAGFDNTGSSLSSPFSFAPPDKAEQPKSPFGAPAMASTEPSKSTGFSFGSSSAPSTSAGTASSSFSFGTGNSSTNGTSSLFSFGATTARPVTPPNQDQEVRMEESPTRDIKPVETRPSLSGFSFNSSPSLFGQNSGAGAPTPSSGSFSFGQSAASSNPFGGMKTDDKPAENKPFGSGAHTPGFSFGRSAENEPPRPSTTGSFSFSSSSNTGPGPTFSFGAPSNNTAPSNPFGATQNESAPTSPATFNQPSPFAFGASNPSAGNPFAFGSQPASPATPSTALPSSGFGSSTSNTFGAPAQSTGFGAAPPASGGSLFTIGAAPSDAGRQIKKLPQRRKR